VAVHDDDPYKKKGYGYYVFRATSSPEVVNVLNACDDYGSKFPCDSTIIKGNYFDLVPEKINGGKKKVLNQGTGLYRFNGREAYVHQEAVLYFNFTMAYQDDGHYKIEDGVHEAVMQILDEMAMEVEEDADWEEQLVRVEDVEEVEWADGD
jgi:hypothetical protein